MPPSVFCQEPDGATDSVFPTFAWAYYPDDTTQAAQASASVAVFTAAQVVAPDFDPDTTSPVLALEVAGDDTDVSSPEALSAGDYTAYITVTDTDDEPSEACTTTFTITASTLARSPGSGATASVGALGCGTYVVKIQDRGGTGGLEIPWASLSYGRKVDDMTDARVTIGTDGLADEECCAALSDIRAWAKEISIWRDGTEVWVGPVGDPEYGIDRVTIPARDLFQWMERRLLEQDRTFTATDLAEIFRQYVSDALSRDTSPAITTEMYSSGVTGDRSVQGAERRRAADELRELARTGVDFTMIGRRLLVAGQELPLPALPLLHDGHVDNPRLVLRGLDAVSEVVVVGATPENSTTPYSGTAGGIDDDIGLVQTTVNESSIKDNDSATQAAQSRLDLFGAPAEFLTVDLTPEATIDFDDLIPGTRWPVGVSVACRTVEGTFRLAEVQVQADASDQGDTETVTVVLEPLGTTDDSEAA